MKVAERRWGEITIKKQGEQKNKFDETKSFSVIKSNNEYSIEQLKEVLETVVNLTDKYTCDELKRFLHDL